MDILHNTRLILTPKARVQKVFLEVAVLGRICVSCRMSILNPIKQPGDIPFRHT